VTLFVFVVATLNRYLETKLELIEARYGHRLYLILQRFPNMLALEKKMKTNNEISSSGCAVWNCFKCKWSLMANVERMSQQPQKG